MPQIDSFAVAKDRNDLLEIVAIGGPGPDDEFTEAMANQQLIGPGVRCFRSAGLDITDAGEQVARVAAQCADVSLLVNNAGVLRYSTFTRRAGPGSRPGRRWRPTTSARCACAGRSPRSSRRRAAARSSTCSRMTSFFTNPFNASYGASKAAGWSLTNGVRLELHHQGTLVVAVHAGFIDTEMAALANAPKISPESVAGQAFDAVEAGQIEVLADERTRDVKATLSRDHELIYPPIQEFWDAAVTGTS